MNEDDKKQDYLENGPFPDDEPYAFMKETVKKHPSRGKKLLLSILAVITGGTVFGVVSGLSFRQVQDITPFISIEADDVSAAELVEEKTPVDEPEAVVVVTPTPQPTDDTEDKEPTVEEKNEMLIQNQKDLYRAFKKVAAIAEPSLVTVQVITNIEDWFSSDNEKASTTSGLILAKTEQDLVILTTATALEENSRLVVTLADGSIADASPVKTDPGTGLSVIKVRKDAVTQECFDAAVVAELGNSYGVTKGQPVIAVGRPNGQSDSISFGAVTSTTGTLSISDAMYTVFTTDIHGSSTSAGYLINMDGQIIASLKAASDETQMTALSLSPVKALIERLSNNQALTYLGLNSVDVTRALSDSTGMPLGVYVTAVDADSPAFNAGVQPGDIIISMNDESVTSMSVYTQLLMAMSPEENVTLVLMRHGAEGYVEMTFTMTAGGI